MPTITFDNNSFFQTATQAGKYRRARGSVGQRRSPTLGDQVRTLVNSNPEAKQVSTVTVASSPSSDTEFSVTIANVEVTYTSDGSATRIEVSQGLYDALVNNPSTGGVCDFAVNTSTGVITCTGKVPGASFSITADPSSELTVATGTAAASADEIPFGAAVIMLGTYADGSQLCGLAKQANLTAQVDTIAIVYASGELYTVTIQIEGETYIAGPVTANTDDATTAQAIVDAINAIMPASTSVIATRSTANVVLTAEVKGKAFVTSVGTKSGTAARMALTHTTSGILTDILQCFGGVAEINNNSEGTYTSSSDAGATSYKPNAGVAAVYNVPGGVFVANDQTPTDNSAVYLETSDSSNTGKFFTTTGATRIKLPPSKFRWIGDSEFAADGLGLLVIS